MRRQRAGVTPRRPEGPAPLESADWEGPYVRYDLVKEFVIALAVITGLVVLLAVLFSSPDEKPVTIQQWARTDPSGFVSTAVTELDGSSEVAGYGAPYTHTPGTGQKIGPLNLQSAAGVHFPINTAQDFVLNPLRSIPGDAILTRALRTYQAAPPAQQKAWTDAYTKALDGAKFPGGIPAAASWQLWAGGADDGCSRGSGGHRWPRRCPAQLEAVLPDELHQAAAVHLGR